MRRAAALAIAGLLFLAGCGEEEGGPVSAGQALKFRAVALVHDGTGFNITATASEDQFDKASEDLDEILASWEWTD